mmetsp:Transcript_30738/g.82307  ORF Transcript_30738/g.82307 Transcript_30738/m.82307 type:complete len:238 (-) Transcript_30738:524-1237(-)
MNFECLCNLVAIENAEAVEQEYSHDVFPVNVTISQLHVLNISKSPECLLKRGKLILHKNSDTRHESVESQSREWNKSTVHSNQMWAGRETSISKHYHLNTSADLNIAKFVFPPGFFHHFAIVHTASVSTRHAQHTIRKCHSQKLDSMFLFLAAVIMFLGISGMNVAQPARPADLNEITVNNTDDIANRNIPSTKQFNETHEAVGPDEGIHSFRCKSSIEIIYGFAKKAAKRSIGSSK